MSNCTAFLSPVPVLNSNRHHVYGFTDRKSSQLHSKKASNGTTTMALQPASPSHFSNGTTVMYTKPATEEKELTYTTIDPLTYFETNTNFKTEKRRMNKRKGPKNPVIIIPGYGAPSKLYEHICNKLTSIYENDIYVCVIPVTIREWAMTVGGKPMTAILQILDDTVKDVLSKTNSNKVTLIGHSAGGWISRIYLGDIPYPQDSTGQIWNGKRYVDQLICLGTPHKSSEPVTKNNMNFVNNNYPEAHYNNDVDYINFAGDAVILPPNEPPLWKFWHPNWMARLSYKLTDNNISHDVLGEGDGIVPLSCTFLRGASNYRLQGVWHSVDSKGLWYGDDCVIKYWSRFLK